LGIWPRYIEILDGRVSSAIPTMKGLSFVWYVDLSLSVIAHGREMRSGSEAGAGTNRKATELGGCRPSRIRDFIFSQPTSVTHNHISALYDIRSCEKRLILQTGSE
jgi:hypothetical protein